MTPTVPAICTKCGWGGSVPRPQAPDLYFIEHPGCNYSAVLLPEHRHAPNGGEPTSYLVQMTAKLPTNHSTAEGRYDALRKTARTLDDARRIVADFLIAGWRDMTAEVVNDDGDVVASYSDGRWQTA